MKKVKLRIKGMHCTSCAMNIDFDLEDLTGVESARTDYAREFTEVEFDESRVKVQDLISTIKKTGYEADVAAA